MNRLSTVTTLAAALLLSGAAAAAGPKAKKAEAPPHQPAPEAALTEGQLEAAGRVFTGEAQCEFGEKIRLSAVDGKPGHFLLEHRKARYTLVPEVTTTGAVRLEDHRAGIVWLQIPAKSMLMNSKIGQRMADHCLLAEQRAAAAVAPDAGAAIGIAAVRP